MNHSALVDIMETKLVAIFRGVPDEKIIPVGAALADGGVKCLELTYDQRSADPKKKLEAQMHAVSAALSDRMHIGVGTVLSEDQAVWAAKLGAEFIVSPVTKEDVIKRTKEMGLVAIPGANTPTEIVNAYEWGADLVKLYTIDDVKTVRYLMGPLGHIPMQVTCGATLDAIPSFLKAGIRAFGTRAMMTDDMVQNGHYEEITQMTKQFLAVIGGAQQ